MTQPQPARTRVPSEQELRQIIVDQDVEQLIRSAEELGRDLAQREKLTTAQVRIFFGAVRQIQAEAQATATTGRLSDAANRKLLLLIPRLAYQAQRDKENRKGEGVLRLKETLTPAIRLVEGDTARFQRFVEFFEAILAYHKAAGGKE
jgi:CRISPR-associated protein Csm2